MDWVLFWTILLLVGVGLVMVYSSSSVVIELKSLQASGEGVAAWSPRRIAAALLGLACAGWMWWRYRNELLSPGWAMIGAGWIAFLQATAYWMELPYAPHYALAIKQIFAALLGFAALIYISQRDYSALRNEQSAFGALGLVIFLLIAVYFLDPKAHRWIKILGVSIQPSELAKPALVLFLAWFVTLRGNINHKHTIWPAALALGMLAGGVVVADFGTALVLVATAAAIFFLAGLSRRYTLAAFCVGTLLLAGAIVAKPYRLKRVVDFADPQYTVLAKLDPQRSLHGYLARNSKVQDTGYQAEQAQIALGSGGIWGRGVGNSRQKLLYLPAAHNDFIYAIVGEEMGLWGAGLLLVAFMVILWRGFRLYFTAPDDFGRYIAIGVTTSLVFQALLNMSVVVGLFPTKGIPLPLISYGGSSLVGTMISLGLLLSVSQRAIRTA
jgi:cell division protein FtsW